MPGPLYFFVYILLSAAILHLVCVPLGKWTLWFFIPLWFVGWFLTIGLAVEKNSQSTFIRSFKKGIKSGIMLLKWWLLYLSGIIAIAAVLAVLSIGQH